MTFRKNDLEPPLRSFVLSRCAMQKLKIVPERNDTRRRSMSRYDGSLFFSIDGHTPVPPGDSKGFHSGPLSDLPQARRDRDAFVAGKRVSCGYVRVG